MPQELINNIQYQLQWLYELDIPFNVNQFLITDSELLRVLDQSINPRETSEKLLICQDGENVDLSLYLDGDVLASLVDNNPQQRLDFSNINNYLTVLEGVSHFLYLVWNARYDRSISLFELELQAEVDKFVVSLIVADSQQSHQLTRKLFTLLFENVSYENNMSRVERQRYEAANHYASLYCKKLAKYFLAAPKNTGCRNELRRFYRLTHRFKLDHIAALGN